MSSCKSCDGHHSKLKWKKSLAGGNTGLSKLERRQGMKKLKISQSMVIGSLLFGMLFGAGNIIFPISMGQMTGNKFWWGALGFLVTAVGLPILAIISFALSEKNSLHDYALPAGRPFAMAFSLILLLTIGPLFATPRTATVAFEVAFAPHIQGEERWYLFAYSLVFFLLVLYFANRPSKILDSIGRYMAPAFFVLISILMLANVFFPMSDYSLIEAQAPYAGRPFTQGMLDGYATMDVLACLAFAGTIIENERRMGVEASSDLAKETGRSSMTTLLLMSSLYIVFTYFGACSMGRFGLQENGGTILALASRHFFGPVGYGILAIIISLACLKTSIGLSVAIPGTLHKMFPKAMSLKKWTFCFVLTSFLIANFGLATIISLSKPFLMFLYPPAIGLVALWILHRIFPMKKEAFRLTMLLACLPASFDFLNAAPAFLKSTSLVESLLGFAKAFLPFFSEGLAWVLPVCLGIVLSLLFLRKKSA